jgi:hypothetical protein
MRPATSDNIRMQEAIDKAGSVRRLAIECDIPIRTLQWQVQRSWFSLSVAKKVAERYKMPKRAILEMAS